MDKPKIMVLICAITVSSFFSLAACGNENNDNSAKNSEPVISENTKQIEKTQDSLADKPNHIKEKIEDNLLVDADIIYPEKTSYETYTVKEKNFTQDIASLFTDDNIKKVSENPNCPGSVMLDMENGGSFWSGGGKVSYSRTDIKDADTFYLLENYINVNGVPEAESEIEGVNRDDAVNCVKEMFYALNEDNTYDLDVSELQVIPFKTTEMNEMRKKAIDRKDFKETAIDEFTEEDDMYYIKLGVNLNGLPIYSGVDEPGLVFAIELHYNAPIYINAIVDSKGIRYFEYNGVVNLINAAESAKNKKVKGRLLNE